MKIYQSILDFLSTQQISFTTHQHPPTLTSADSARERGEDLSTGAKAIVLKVQDAFCLFVMRADTKLDSKLVKQQFKEMGRRAKKIRFATKEELLERTGLVPGSIPPFGKPILPFELFVDKGLLENTTISFNAGSLEHSVSMSRSDYLQVANAQVFQFTSNE